MATVVRGTGKSVEGTGNDADERQRRFTTPTSCQCAEVAHAFGRIDLANGDLEASRDESVVAEFVVGAPHVDRHGDSQAVSRRLMHLVITTHATRHASEEGVVDTSRHSMSGLTERPEWQVECIEAAGGTPAGHHGRQWGTHRHDQLPDGACGTDAVAGKCSRMERRIDRCPRHSPCEPGRRFYRSARAVDCLGHQRSVGHRNTGSQRRMPGRPSRVQHEVGQFHPTNTIGERMVDLLYERGTSIGKPLHKRAFPQRTLFVEGLHVHGCGHVEYRT